MLVGKVKETCSHSNPSKKIKVDRWCNPLGDPTSQLPCALRVYLPVNSHTCQTPWFVFQDGSNGEPTVRCQERANVETCQKARAANHDRDGDVSTGGTCARSATEDASLDYNLEVDDARFSSWALPNSLAITRGVLGQRSEGRAKVREGDVEVKTRHRGWINHRSVATTSVEAQI
ncbi:hypothetical protein E5676_scaffold3741G00020 [Cucumis melo var. makuwa]|uniref:Uncharacterized protein n=1 Tax=Cucumis melo var. makuwa TaxID=1194695 RepID=A0A5D3BRY0_CUCMM|nr:hypothetical protein E6C27_scaffold11823G00040 [Cucumis melo var. makuwa]TYK01914.1 hypothetical protein E5676_scaffold3741G00020 [Cucumis melo var. makuwa]